MNRLASVFLLNKLGSGLHLPIYPAKSILMFCIYGLYGDDFKQNEG